MNLHDIEIRAMTMADYEGVAALWQAMPSMFSAEDDSRDAIAKYLERNCGMSFVAIANGGVVGAVLGGHDGRRGFLHHLAVAENFRRTGIATQLWQRSVAALKKAGIRRSHVFVRVTNAAGLKFWADAKWMQRTDIAAFSHNPQH